MHLCVLGVVCIYIRVLYVFTPRVCTRVRSHVRVLACSRTRAPFPRMRFATFRYRKVDLSPVSPYIVLWLSLSLSLFEFAYLFVSFSFSSFLPFFFLSLQLLLRPGSRFPTNRSFRARFHRPFSFFCLLYKLDYINNYLSITFYATFLVSHLTRRLV